MRHIIATCFKIAQSYDQAVQAYAKASEALFKADRYIHKKKKLGANMHIKYSLGRQSNGECSIYYCA